MGLLGAIGNGLASVGGTVEKIGLEQIRAGIEADRDARLQTMKAEADAIMRERNKADAAEERGRIKADAQGIAEQRGGLLSASAGLDDPNYRGDEGIGVNVQQGQQAPTARDLMMAKGDYSGVATLEERDVDNKRQDARDKVSAEHSDRDFKLREKQLAQSAGESSLRLKTAQLAYDRAVAEDKIPVAVSKSFEALKQRYHDLLTISSKNDFDPNTETGKRVLADQVATSERMAQLMTPYMPDDLKAQKQGGASKADLFPPKDQQPTTQKPAVVTQKPAAQPSQQAEPENQIVSLEPAGKTMFGGKQFVATYKDGTRKVVSGDDVERQAILMGK